MVQFWLGWVEVSLNTEYSRGTLDRMNVAFSITLLGMAIVFGFIGILAVCIKLLERFRSEDSVPAPATAGTAETLPTTAIIAAAIHAHRSKMKRK
jgi:sodium pump decarboxylase gamma subunit